MGGCVIYELFVDQILFSGSTNNEMIKLIMEFRGHLPKKMLRKGAFTKNYFDLSDPNTPFCCLEKDPITKQLKIRMISTFIVKKSFSQLLFGVIKDKTKKVFQFIDLLEKMMLLDPEKRLTASQ